MDDRERHHLEKQLKVAESDLKDSYDPKVLKDWPNLGRQECIDAIRYRIKTLKERLGK